MDKILAEDVMTPSTVMLTFHRKDKIGEIVEEHSPIPFSRIPVDKISQGNEGFRHDV